MGTLLAVGCRRSRNVWRHWWQQYGPVRLYQNLTPIEFAARPCPCRDGAVPAIDDLLLVEISPRCGGEIPSATAVEVSALQAGGLHPN